ncbi:MAG: DNA polymerase I [Christensenellales bacterium]
MRSRCAIVDGHSLMYRAFHALPLMDADGVYTNAVHGFLSMLFRALREYHPEYCVVAFDEHGPTFRHEVYQEYKAGRAPMPEELRSQFPLIKELLGALGVGVISLPGYEADDLLGTVAKQANARGIEALLITGDRDALQLVSEDTSLLLTRRGISETLLCTPANMRENFGLSAEQVPDWKGLMGDASDNIPGIPGVGEKTSLKLLAEYGTLEGVLLHAGDIKGKLGEKIRDNMALARFSRQLATIDREAPFQATFQEWIMNRLQAGIPALRKYQLNTLVAELTRMTADLQGEIAKQDKALPPLMEARDIPHLVDFASPLEAGGLIVCLAEDAFSLTDTQGRGLRLPLKAGQQDFLSLAGGAAEDEVLRAIAPLLQKTGLITHDAKRFFHRLRALKLPIPELLEDTMVQCYLHDPQERSYVLSAFASPDAQGVWQLLSRQRALLEEEGMAQLYREVELPLVRVLYDMEVEGFQVDRAPLEEMGVSFTRQTLALQEEIYKLSGARGFNLNSPQQLGKVLFEDLALPTRRKTKSGWSTDADTLEDLRDLHPVIDRILEYRQIVKLNGTYIEGLLRKVDETGRIHTTFDQVGTATGRISSNEPNLQNIPVRTALGREIRRAFVAKPGHVLVDGDYSQIELRILAHMSGDQAMCDAFLRGQDIHTRTAAEINGVPMQQVTAEMRSAAKAVNFGIVYGISEFGLARNIGISRKRAGDFISRYFERYPLVQSFMEQAKIDGYTKSYATTLYGRRRQLDELKSPNQNIRNFGERAAMNTPIQGTAADVIKAAMVAVHRELRREGLAARLILQVHDELIIETPQHEQEAVAALLKRCMEQVIKLKVPLVSDVHVGRSWYDTK